MWTNEYRSRCDLKLVEVPRKGHMNKPFNQLIIMYRPNILRTGYFMDLYEITLFALYNSFLRARSELFFFLREVRLSSVLI